MTQNTRKEMDPKDINLRSDDVSEILGRPPGWLVRWGTILLLLITLMVITGSSFFTYPDIVRAPVVITKENPPSVLVARTSGRPQVIFYPDGSVVRKNDTLAVMENSSRYNDIFRLRGSIREINRLILQGSDISGLHVPADLVLGDVQPSYNLFASSLHDYRIFMSQGFYEKRIAALIEELNEYAGYRGNLERQAQLALHDLQLAKTRFTRDSLLFASNVIPLSDYEKAQVALLEKQKAVETARLGISDAGIMIARLERSITDTRMEKDERQQQLYTQLINSFRQLESSLASWENAHMIVAPATGTLNYLNIWSSLQEVRAGDPLFSIIPEEMGDIHTRITLPFRGAGKVRPGQRVNIKLEGYPYMEFGIVEGRVMSVSGAPLEQGFPAVVTLTNGAVTSFGHELEVIRQMPGIAEISTDEISLLERIFSPLRHLLKNRTI